MIYSDSVEDRIFPNWSMAYVGVDPVLEEQFFIIAEESNCQRDIFFCDKAIDELRKKYKSPEDILQMNAAA